MISPGELTVAHVFRIGGDLPIFNRHWRRILPETEKLG
jgi:hypothetical protein